MRTTARRLVSASLPALLGASACLPYTVGSTAETVPVGRTTSSMSYYYIPNAFKAPGDTIAAPMAGVDREWRHGLDARSDFGVRLTSGAGIVVNYKQRYRDFGGGGPALAYMVGAGVVNAGEHAHFEGTLIASGDERAEVMPFGGVRAMQVVPISAGAVHDSPTIGAFGGVQLGDASFTVRPELGVFYDRSALGVRSANVIIVPAVTIQRREGRRRSESRDLRPPAMAGTGDLAREPGLGRAIRCLLVSCSGSESSSGSLRPRTIVLP